MSKRFGFLGVLVAGAVGLVAGLLTAPKPGKETREDVKVKADELKERAGKALSEGQTVAKEKATEVKARAGEKADELKAEARTKVDEVVGEAKRRTGEAKDEVRGRLTKAADQLEDDDQAAKRPVGQHHSSRRDK